MTNGLVSTTRINIVTASRKKNTMCQTFNKMKRGSLAQQKKETLQIYEHGWFSL